MIYHVWLQRLDYDSKTMTPEQVRKAFDDHLEVGQWATPMKLEVKAPEPRVTEDGLTVPDWWTDEETESQQMLAAMGMG